MDNNLNENNKISNEEELEKIKKNFINIIPQLQDIKEVEEVYQEVQRKKLSEQYPFINTQSYSTT